MWRCRQQARERETGVDSDGRGCRTAARGVAKLRNSANSSVCAWSLCLRDGRTHRDSYKAPMKARDSSDAMLQLAFPLRSPSPHARAKWRSEANASGAGSATDTSASSPLGSAYAGRCVLLCGVGVLFSAGDNHAGVPPRTLSSSSASGACSRSARRRRRRKVSIAPLALTGSSQPISSRLQYINHP